jgi:hypothetical protein
MEASSASASSPRPAPSSLLPNREPDMDEEKVVKGYWSCDDWEGMKDRVDCHCLRWPGRSGSKSRSSHECPYNRRKKQLSAMTRRMAVKASRM